MVIIVVSDKCTGCETCVNNCPVSVYEIQNGKSVPVKVEDCILCRTCESQCPEGAIQVIEVEVALARVEPPKVEVEKILSKKTKKKASHKTARAKRKDSN